MLDRFFQKLRTSPVFFINDPDPLGDPAAPSIPVGGGAPVASSRAKHIECDFCKCTLAPSGDVLAMSAEARAFRDLREKNIKLEKQLVEASTDCLRKVAELEQQIAGTRPAAPAAPVSSASGHLHATR